MELTVHGYRYSVYTRILKMTLAVRGVAFTDHEIDPFADPPDPLLHGLSPFGRVPVLDHDGFVLCETGAICRYVASVFPGPALVPDDPKASARMAQTIAAVDAYGYQPMVRQVFSHAVFRPMIMAPADPQVVQAGLEASAPLLAFLDEIAGEGLVLSGHDLTLADLHLAPMIGYFSMAPKGATRLASHANLSRWWVRMRQHPAYLDTDPGIATMQAE